MGLSGNLKKKRKLNEQIFQKVKQSRPFPQSRMRYYSHVITLKAKADEELQPIDQQSLLSGPFGH